MFSLFAMTLAIGVGLLVWGPVSLDAQSHRYADHRALAGIPNGLNVALSLPMLFAAMWGWRVLPKSGWPEPLQRPWRLCFVSIGLTAALAAAYHMAPGDAGYLAAQAAAASAFVMLLCGFLSERVDPRFGSRVSCAAALAVALLAAGLAIIGHAPDMRPLLLLQLMPVLLIPAGALSLPARHTRRGDWLLILGLYALARVWDLADGEILRLTDNIVSGHALMHVSAGAVVTWLAYCAKGATGASDGFATDTGATQASTSLITSG